MQKLRFGVIGTNFITDWVIAGAREDERFELAAVCSRTQERADAFAAKYNIPHTFTSVDEMAKSPHIDAVYIASPNTMHTSQTIICVSNGKHVLCEKPLATNIFQADAMRMFARHNNVTLMEAMKPTLTPAFRAVREAIGRIGKPRQYFSAYCQYSSRYDKLKEGVVLNAFNPELGGGAVMDIGVYTIYPMVVLFGSPKSLCATGLKLDSGVDGHGTAVFKYGSGLSATVIYSKVVDSCLPTEIQGEDGTIIIDRINRIGNVTFKPRNGEPVSLMPKTPHNEYYYEIKEFIDLVQAHKLESEINSLSNSINVISLTDEIRRQLDIVFPMDIAK
jgi:predicted dehydrogenase